MNKPWAAITLLLRFLWAVVVSGVAALSSGRTTEAQPS